MLILYIYYIYTVYGMMGVINNGSKVSHTPILTGVEKSQTHFTVLWLDGKPVEIVRTA